MGVRGELFSTKVALQNRTYFFNVKENRVGDLYLNIVESKNRDEGGFERQSVILFAEDLQEFLQGFDESLKVLEKAVREKRRGPANKRERPAAGEKRPASDDGEAETPPHRGFRNKKRDEDSAPRPPRGSKFNDRPQWGNNDDSGRDSPRFHDGPRPKRPGSFGRDRTDSSYGGESRPRRGPASDSGRDRKDSRDKGKFGPGKKRVVVRKK